LALSGFFSYFAAEMKKKLLFIMLLFLSVGGNLMAQQQLYICRGGQADAYEVNCMSQLEMEADSFHIRQQPVYAMQEVDSIVFRRPVLPCRELGWWGDMTDGQSQYKAHLNLVDMFPELNGQDISMYEFIEFDVLFIIKAQAGICQTVRCELRFSEEWMFEAFQNMGVWDFDVADGPYIYVKETATGPRRFETWVIYGPVVVPYECIWMKDSTMFWSNCSALLSGRPMEDVQIIIEAWVHQQPKRVINPNYIQP
jgi:hypothetical protein